MRRAFTLFLTACLLATGCWSWSSRERHFIPDPPESLLGRRTESVRAIHAPDYRYEVATGLIAFNREQAGKPAKPGDGEGASATVRVLDGLVQEGAGGEREVAIGSGKLSDLVDLLHPAGTPLRPLAAGVFRQYPDGGADLIVSDLERLWLCGDLEQEVELRAGDLIFLSRSANSLIAELYGAKRILAEWNE